MSLKIFKNKKKTFLIFFSLILIAGLFFSYGFLSYHTGIFPYGLIITAYELATEEKGYLYEWELPDIIQIENENDVLQKRDNLVQLIWKQEGLPTKKYPTVEPNIHDNRFAKLKNLGRIDKLTVGMDYNLTSILYHFHSSKPSKGIFIYHQGHLGGFILGHKTIDRLLDNGYDVIAASMPLRGMNAGTTIELPRFGKITLTYHDQLKFLDNQNFSSIKFFIEPVIVAVNYAQELGYGEIYMTGISGGGWTTVLSAAADPRISRSYPVAGSYPLHLLSQNYGENFGDYERTDPGLYKTTNYLELYILGSFGTDRRQVQMINVYDRCCYFGHKYKSYGPLVYKKMEMLGKGNFTIFADSSHRGHKISDIALNYIINDLE